MKIHAILAVNMLFACSLYAQRVEIHANVGASLTGAVSAENSPVFASNAGRVNGAGLVAALVNVGKWQAGVSVQGQRVAFDNTSAVTRPNKIRFILSNPLIAANAQVSRRFSVGIGSIYVGVQGGILRSVNDSYLADAPTAGETNQGKSDRIKLPGGNGFNVGGQIGYRHMFTKRIGLNVDISPRYNSITVKSQRPDIAGKYQFVTVPATVGAVIGL